MLCGVCVGIRRLSVCADARKRLALANVHTHFVCITPATDRCAHETQVNIIGSVWQVAAGCTPHFTQSALAKSIIRPRSASTTIKLTRPGGAQQSNHRKRSRVRASYVTSASPPLNSLHQHSTARRCPLAAASRTLVISMFMRWCSRRERASHIEWDRMLATEWESEIVGGLQIGLDCTRAKWMGCSVRVFECNVTDKLGF